MSTFVSLLTFAICSSPFGHKFFSFYLTRLFTPLSVAPDHETWSVFCQTSFWNQHNKRITIFIYNYLSISLALDQHYWYFSMLHWFSHHFYIKHVKNRESHSILKLPASLTLTVYSVSYFTPFSTQPNCHECDNGDSDDGNGDDSFRILWSTFLPRIVFAKHRVAAFWLIYQFEKFMNSLLLHLSQRVWYWCL